VLGDAVINDRLSFRLRQLSFSLKQQVLDGLLIRVSSLDNDLPRAFALHTRFSDALTMAVSPLYRARFIGATSEVG